MDGIARYNQIFMAEEDIHKTAFRCPGALGLYEWVIVTFGLKNAGATYQRAMDYIFHELIDKIIEIYIDDVVVKLRVIKNIWRILKDTYVCQEAWIKDKSTQVCFWSISWTILGFHGA